MDTVKRGLDDEHSHLDSELKCHTVNSHHVISLSEDMARQFTNR